MIMRTTAGINADTQLHIYIHTYIRKLIKEPFLDLAMCMRMMAMLIPSQYPPETIQVSVL